MIDINKKYTTTTGGEVTLYTANGRNQDYPIVGEVVYQGGGCQVRRWDKNGKALASVGDLVEVPIWEPSPELVAVLRPGWIVCDCDGDWWLYSRKPRKTKDGRYWFEDSGGEVYDIGVINSGLLPPVNDQTTSQAFKIGNPE